MKITSVLVSFVVVLCAVPAMAFNDIESGLHDKWAALQYPPVTSQDYRNVVDKLVKAQSEIDRLRADAQGVQDQKNDILAIGIAAGVFIGSGGVIPLANVVGSIIATPFIFLGF